MKHALSLFFIVVFSVVIGSAIGCAPQTKVITINSNPPFASIFYNDSEEARGKTPLIDTLPFADYQTYNVKLSLEGYRDTAFTIAYMPLKETEYMFNLQRGPTDVVKIDLVSFEPAITNIGIKLTRKQRRSLAYLEVIERSVNVRSVTKITENQETGTQIGNPVVSPSGKIMIYSMIATDERGKSYANIWKQTIGAYGKTRITNGSTFDIFPAFSHDEEYIYFSSNRISDNMTIWKVRLDGGGGIMRITNTQAEDYGVSIFNDGSSFAYTSNPPAANAPQIWTSNTSGSLLTQLREGEFPQVSPDNSKILFVREDKNNIIKRYGDLYYPKQIWLMGIEGNGETQLTQNVTYNTVNPRWSPDGKWIAYASDEGMDNSDANNYDIWLMRSDGTGKTQLTTNGSWDDNPCWSNDGSMIYFRSNRGGIWNIWRLEPILPK